MPIRRQDRWKLFRTVNEAKSRKSGNLTGTPKPPRKKKSPKVSIMTYVYCTKQNNRWQLLKECIQSIRMQGYPNYEHIIVDDGSPVQLGNRIKKLRDNHIKYYRKKHTGILKSTKTFNYGLRVMTGKYGMILSSDDAHLKGTIRRLVNYLDTHKKVVAVTGNVLHQRLTRNGKLRGQYKTHRNERKPIKVELMKHNCVNACATMFRTSALRKISLPPDQTGFAADYDLWVRLSEIGPIKRIPDVLIKYRNFGNATRIKTQKDEDYRKKCIWHVKKTARTRRRKNK